MRPKCSACNDLNFNCVYVQPASTVNAIVGKDYLYSIEERLKLVEQKISALQASQAVQSPRHMDFADETENDGSYPEGIDGTTSARQETPANVSGPNVQQTVTLEDETDGVGGVIFSVEQDCGFFGDHESMQS